MPILDLAGDYGTDVRPARVAAGRKLWAKDPSGASATDGTRLDATFVNDLLGMIRAAATAYSVTQTPGDDDLLADILAAAISSRAPLASPALTGTPTAPTAALGTNTTQIASTAFVQAAVSALISAAPGALDTLDELAAALGDDANFAATVTTALAGKQPLDAELTAIAGLTSAVDRLPYFTGSGTAALATFTAFGRTLVDDADASAARTTLGLVPGTDVQAYNARLADLAGASWTQGDIVYFNGTNLVRLPAGTSGYFLKTLGAGANPAWDAPGGSTQWGNGAAGAIYYTGGSVGIGTSTPSDKLHVLDGNLKIEGTTGSYGISLRRSAADVATITTASTILTFQTINGNGFQWLGSGGAQLLALNNVGGVAFSLGSAAGPSISFSGDSNTGIYSSGADTLDFATGGTMRLRVSSAGLLQFAGATSSYPALKRSNAEVHARLADDTAYANMVGAIIEAKTSVKFADATTQTTAFAPYTGSTELATVFPVGHTVIVDTGTPVAKNSTTTIYAGNSGTGSDSRYNIAATGSALTGTWRSRGSVGGYTIYERVA